MSDKEQLPAHNPALQFYQFLGAHSLLIGLLPFYLPVYLWKSGYSLAHISLLIGLSGFAFCAALSLWQTVSRQYSLRFLLCLSFLLELLLVASVFTVNNSMFSIILIGTFNGLYNGFFWTTQRTQFLQLLGQNDTGKRYGNFQIFVTVFLKVGILLGGWMLDIGGLAWLFLLSAILSAIASFWFYRTAKDTPLYQDSTITWVGAMRYTDRFRSRPVFFADGFFLFLESHYWTLSLFMLADENFARLGVVVVILAVVFSLLFLLIKNTIDNTAVDFVFKLAVYLYALSWIARAFVSDERHNTLLLLLLVLITFCSSFFRLAFNKRFFDLAQRNSGVQYLLIKSYQSQFILGTGFCSIAVFLFTSGQPFQIAVIVSYAIAALVSLVYLLYQPGRSQP